MIRVSKLTDYAMVIMVHLGQNPQYLFQAKEIAGETEINHPTVSKILKLITKGKLLTSHRGASGGYKLAKAPSQISVLDIIQAIEGPLAITECNLIEQDCAVADHCSTRAPWQYINQRISETLEKFKLSDLVTQNPQKTLSLKDKIINIKIIGNAEKQYGQA